MQEAPIQPVFAMGDLAFLGVDMPSVPVGDAVFPVLTTRPNVRGPFTGSDVANETDGAFDAELLAPERVQASFFYRRTDAARFGMMGESLREALNSGLTEKIDAEGINGTNGLLTGTNLENHNASAITTYANYVSQFGYNRVDGRYAPTPTDLRVLVGSTTYAHMGGVYRSASTDLSAVDRLMLVTGKPVRVSAHVPAAAGNKQNGLIRLGMRRDMVCPTWSSASLIYDEITGQKKGEINITAVVAVHHQDPPRGRILPRGRVSRPDPCATHCSRSSCSWPWPCPPRRKSSMTPRLRACGSQRPRVRRPGRR